MSWYLEPWLIEAVIIIAASFIIGVIVGKAIACINGTD
jgi:hypothetical protein